MRQSNTKPRSEATTIGALSERTGVNIETIRYYERIGLLPAPPRSAGRHRLYGEPHRRRLAFIRRARELGFALDEVRALLGLGGGHDLTCGEVSALARRHIGSIREKIRDLKKLERTLSDLVARCAGGDVPDCPILETLSAAA
jgi:MerR family transcriptional regulator, mercuric resistance operon regulatory protein